MNSKEDIISLVSYALEVILILSLPPVIAVASVGLLVSLILALTQLQEQTISFAFKLVAIIITMLFGGIWMAENIVHLTLFSFGSIR